MGAETAAVGLAIDIISNPKVHDMAARLFESVYGRIFRATESALVDGTTLPKPPTDRELLEKIIENQPTSLEMGVAFSALQAELRRGQQRLWFGLAGLALLNTALISVLIFR